MKTRNLLLTMLMLALVVPAQVKAQQQPPAEKQNPNGFYIGLQGNSPLFWGDLFSLGDETRLGYGGGLFAGYTFGKWFSPELSFHYGVGRLGAKELQLGDYVGKNGIITYVPSGSDAMKLGDLYSKAQYLQGGLRLQMGLLSLFNPDKYHPFDIELAPAVYAQKFSPKLYTVADDKEWSKGTDGGDWNYAVGGDVGLRFRFSPKVSAHLRGGLLWMRNEAFDGIDNDPLWRVNLMADASVGVTFHLGKSAPAPVVIAPVVDDTSARDAELEALRRAEQERMAREQAEKEAARLLAEQQAKEKATREAYIKEVEGLQIPALFFRRGYADINMMLYQSNLDEIVAIAQKYQDTKIEVEGWCDVTGTEVANATLSQKRAGVLKEYLTAQGIAGSRFTKVEGMGVDRDGGYSQAARRAIIKLIP